MEKLYYSSPEIADAFVKVGVKKTSNPLIKQLLFGFMAGMFLALVCHSTNIAAHTIESYGLAKTLAGAIFPAGLIIIVLAGGELFTGNCLNLMSVLEKKISPISMVTNLIMVYTGNFIGSILMAYMIAETGQLSAAGVGGYTLKVAYGKATLDFMPALILGILCNILVCVAVWMAASAGDVAGKIWAMFFPILVFVISGYEHSVANMYYIPAGIFAKSSDPEFLASIETLYGVTADKIDSITWGNMFINNLLPVTIGNFIGGAIFIGFFYWLIHLNGKKH